MTNERVSSRAYEPPRIAERSPLDLPLVGAVSAPVVSAVFSNSA